MIYHMAGFEVFVIALKGKYESITRGNFYEDFGLQGLAKLRALWEAGSSHDEALDAFLSEIPIRSRCACECGALSRFG